MSQRLPPDPAPPPASQESVVSSEETARHGGSTEGRGADYGDDSYEPADPHPDTPDDFEEDAVPARESIEHVPEIGDEEDDD